VSAATLRVRCSLMRGGTSRGLVFRREDLPVDRGLWNAVFLAAIGSPDPRQLDGVGAGDSHTSKIAVVEPGPEGVADLDYLFGEVAIREARVDYAGNSGNLIAALGLYALEAGWVEPVEPETRVRVRNLNTNKLTELFVPVAGGAPAADGDFRIDGVPGYGPRIDLLFPEPQGAITGRLLPTGEVLSRLEVPGLGAVEVSLVDAANPVVLVTGESLGISPQDPVPTLNADGALLERIQALRAAAAVAMGLVERADDAWSYSPMVPFPVILFPPSGYPSFPDPSRSVAPQDMDLCARVVSLNLFHKSINVTVTVAVATAALVPGTLAERLSGGRAFCGRLRIGHPSGVMDASVGPDPSGIGARWVRLGRTARRILDGEVLVQPSKLRWLRELGVGG
jgi:2-methylaconitate cis-trans-isomerase PrpF